MTDTFVELPETPVLRLKADLKGGGPAEAFRRLEAKLPTVKGRKFYGTFHFTSAGPEYYACVARLPNDDPDRFQLEEGTISGGWYARRKLPEWEAHVAELPGLFQEMMRTHHADTGRPTLEFYRSRTEMHLLVPLPARPAGVPSR